MLLRKKVIIGAALFALTLVVGAAAGQAAAEQPLRTYRVTLVNLTNGQPFSPPVAATGKPNVHIFQVGQLASDEIEAIAEDGNEVPAFNALSGNQRVTEAIDVGRPLTPHGQTVGSFTDTVTFDIHAHPGDRLSLATMLICTNDGFIGLAGAHLPAHGQATYHLPAYDAGTELNTEQSEDIVDPCSALGSTHLAGDPNGNEDAAVDVSPAAPITYHHGIQGMGDLTVSAHDWSDPVASVMIEAMD